MSDNIVIDDIINNMTVDDVLEEREIIENPVMELEIDNEFEVLDKREQLQDSYNEYSDSYIELTELLGTIIKTGEYTEENKQQVLEINDVYDEKYETVVKQLDKARKTIEDNKSLDFNGSVLMNTQDDVFNALTKNGEVQAIYRDSEGRIYINAQYLQTRGLRVVNDDGETTLYINEQGNLTTSGDIVGGTITGTKLKAMTIDTNEVNIESKDGSMVLQGATQQFKDKNNNIRIHIGKDTNGDFVFKLMGANGETVLIDQNGIKQDAIQSNTITADHIKTEVFDGINANIINLTSDKANITDLNATNANITNLKSDVASINTLLAGNITSENIQTGAITAGSGIIADGAIGSAQISEVDAGKISAGKIDTSKVEVSGKDGHLKIKGNRLQVFQGIGSQAKERVSLGDVDGNGSVYGLRVRGEDGQTVLLDENGVKSEGITDGAITNDKISDNANIDGDKLNINSVVSKINEDETESIQGVKIEVDGASLITKLSTITNKQTEHGEKITQNSSTIKANQDAIKLKVDSQTYETDKTNMTNKLDKNTSDISIMKDEIALKVEQTDIENAKNEIEGIIDTKIDSAKSEVKVTTDAISGKVSNLETTTSTIEGKVNSHESRLTTAESKITDKAIINTVSSTIDNKVNTGIKNIQIGDRNLLLMENVVNRDSSNFTKEGYSVAFTHEEEYQGIQINNLRETMELDKEYCLQYKIKKIEGTLIGITQHCDPQFEIIDFVVDDKLCNATSTVTDMGINDDNWHNCTLRVKRKTDKATDESNRIILQPNRGLATSVTVEMKDFKISQGNKFGGWTPAPEDVQNRILDSETILNSNIDNAISSAKDDILDNVSQNYATSDKIIELQETVSSNMQQTNKDINMRFETAQNYTKEVDGKLQAYQNTVATNIRFSENGIELGKTSSPFTAALDNTKLAFKQNGEEVAYISNNKMHITQAEIKDNLRVGDSNTGFFTWTKGTNGNLSLKWSES